MHNYQSAIQLLTNETLDEIKPDSAFRERSELAQEIISRKPDFYERWALPMFLALLLLLAAGTWFIKYPDIVPASATLTGNNAPKEIVTRQAGKLTAIFVSNNDSVKQGDILGWIESNADTREVIDVSDRLNATVLLLEKGAPENIATLVNKRFTRLGELQTSYQTFISAWQQYNDYLVNGFYAKRKKMLHRDIAALQTIEQQVSTQKRLTTEDNSIASTTFDMYKQLYEEKVISAEEFRKAQSVLLSKQLSLPQVDANIISQQNQIREKQKEIDQVAHDILQQQQTFEQALYTLKSEVDQWLRNYTIQAPADGKVVLALPLQQHQFLEQGKLIGYVNPANSQYYAEIKLAQYNFGKVDTGMKVQLRFVAYPYQETGFLQGTLNYVSEVAVDSGFIGTVRLDQGLLTNQAKTIPYKNGLKADALIITRDMRLLERLYYSVIKTTSIDK
ncbi:HlyD family secretion protein [Chitinophaga horti]|uniref:HlyD family secretion protein n=1 Tax=Chitinophaga horti TaxID=2920382 RepID=A0ABY6JC12_9BACT|nr:HlyD family secretion protein [Chitinophaga horti]UYQ95739.1 HlyD family secretion protein [Chitinophaga horti]